MIEASNVTAQTGNEPADSGDTRLENGMSEEDLFRRYFADDADPATTVECQRDIMRMYGMSGDEQPLVEPPSPQVVSNPYEVEE